MATLLYVTRHGQTDANLARRVQGQGDTPLNAAGMAQARRLAAFFSGHPVDRILSSDLLRARQTAEVLTGALGVPATYHAELRARRMGAYEDRTHEELAAADPEGFRRLKHDPEFVPPGGGESVEQLRERAIPFARAAAERHPGGRLVILSHHKVCQLILAELAGGGRVVRVPNARPAVVIFEGGTYRLADKEVFHGAA